MQTLKIWSSQYFSDEDMKSTFKLLQYFNYFIYNIQRKTHCIYESRKIKNINNLPINTIMITIEKNVFEFNVKFATLKTIRNLINTKQNI